MAEEDGDLAADKPLHPSKCNSARSFPHVAAIDLHHRRDFPSPLGERFIHLAVAGAAAPPILVVADTFDRGTLDLDPTDAYRFD